MSESRRRSDAHREAPWAQQGPESAWTAGGQGIDPSEAAAFRRRLDHQASAELIPLAGPDAAADQGPAIKAVWEPAPPRSAPAAHTSRRRDRRGPSGRGGHGRSHRKRRAMVVGAVLAIVLAAGGYVEMSDKGPSMTKGAATTILPPAASPSDTGVSVDSSLGTSVSLTNPPSRSRSASASPSASTTHSAAASQSATPSPGGTSGSVSPSPSSRPSPSPSPSQTHCFLFFCG
ncbi:MAG TPA: hypothetical protein VGS97_14185 [Actinocrinis sp.]|uniref:hypothetical protein n=1 Tax=Actinocrinis sp. TaxID=1920516 RepID=UPI002DDD8CA6|nr:hypothetical protein [Actinocrinis sp.]HEV2345243.1 hypothetical protein [Actinocrinis sp.]